MGLDSWAVLDDFIFLSLFVKCMWHPEERCRLRLTAFSLLKSSKHCRSHSRPALEAMMSLLHLCSEMYKLFDARQELQNLPYVMVAHVPSPFKDIDHQDRTVIILSFTPGWCSQLNFASESIRSSVRGRPRRIFIGQWQYLECRAADCCFNVSIRHKILSCWFCPFHVYTQMQTDTGLTVTANANSRFKDVYLSTVCFHIPLMKERFVRLLSNLQIPPGRLPISQSQQTSFHHHWHCQSLPVTS